MAFPDYDRSVGRERLRAGWEAIRRHWFAYLFVAPTVAYLVALVWYPGVRGLAMSLYRWPLFGDPTWVGFGNYLELLTWDVFYTSLRATLIYGLQTVLQVVIGTTMALVVWKQERWTGLLSVAFLLPFVFPTLVTGTLWRYLLDPAQGPIFALLVDAGVLDRPIYWDTQGGSALAVLVVVGVWTWTPFVFLLVLASLQNVPDEQFESAKIYGAGVWDAFRHVTFPHVRSAILVALVLRVVRNLGKVSQPLQITRGGPGWETSVLGILLYRLAWRRHELGLAFAVGVILSLVSLAFVVVFIWQFERASGEVRV